MVCKKCGFELPVGATYCDLCGEKVTDDKPQNKPSTIAVSSTQNVSKDKEITQKLAVENTAKGASERTDEIPDDGKKQTMVEPTHEIRRENKPTEGITEKSDKGITPPEDKVKKYSVPETRKTSLKVNSIILVVLTTILLIAFTLLFTISKGLTYDNISDTVNKMDIADLKIGAIAKDTNNTKITEDTTIAEAIYDGLGEDFKDKFTVDNIKEILELEEIKHFVSSKIYSYKLILVDGYKTSGTFGTNGSITEEEIIELLQENQQEILLATNQINHYGFIDFNQFQVIRQPVL